MVASAGGCAIAAAVAAVPAAVLVVAAELLLRQLRAPDRRAPARRARPRAAARVRAPARTAARASRSPSGSSIDRLNDLGYAERVRPEKPGEFAIGNGAVAIMPRGADLNGQVVRVVFQRAVAAGEDARDAAANQNPRGRPITSSSWSSARRPPIG